jgi:LmbE family N-acetylglucosaminyl deacetylase
MQTNKHIFLSPHLDDAIFSCGGLINHITTMQNQTAIIINAMAGDPPDPLPETPIIRDLHERWRAGESPVAVRRSEDEAAVRSLNVRSVYMPLPECVYRTAQNIALYPSEESLFGEVHPLDPAHTLLESTSLPAIDEISHLYAPLAAGHHVDHQVIRDWAYSLAKKNPALTLLFYEDYPYSQQSASMDTALALHPRPLQPEIVPLDEDDFEAKVRAIQHYRSQLSTFWRDEHELRQQVRAFMTGVGDGQLAERYWRPE